MRDNYDVQKGYGEDIWNDELGFDGLLFGIRLN